MSSYRKIPADVFTYCAALKSPKESERNIRACPTNGIRYGNSGGSFVHLWDNRWYAWSMITPTSIATDTNPTVVKYVVNAIVTEIMMMVLLLAASEF